MPDRKKTRAQYRKIYKKYHSSEKAKKERNMRNQARRRAKRKGLVKKGDGMEIDHIRPISKGGSNNPKNLRVVKRRTNRRKGAKMRRRK
jgi:5-methylcytosine-specific restriction endonuclease McrA